ncbi:hypothetical protein ACFYWN_23315 [Streptomyces sp. NPDC002917]|uniref:hypothetical protein n=1 Tax=Streptomyces sp. NPDC002917 TaxID=3364671 RepID=UPI0036AFA5CB
MAEGTNSPIGPALAVGRLRALVAVSGARDTGDPRCPRARGIGRGLPLQQTLPERRRGVRQFGKPGQQVGSPGSDPGVLIVEEGEQGGNLGKDGVVRTHR